MRLDPLVPLVAVANRCLPMLVNAKRFPVASRCFSLLPVASFFLIRASVEELLESLRSPAVMLVTASAPADFRQLK